MRHAFSFLAFFMVVLLAAADAPTNRVVVLANEKVLEGEIERTGDRLVIRRNGAETTIPASQAAFVGPDLKSAHAYMQSKANLKLAEERLRLAKWCHANAMRAEAIHEIEAALDLKPNWLPAITLLQQVKSTRESPVRPSEPTNSKSQAPPDAVDCSPEAIKLFGTKVQPILMNACAGCHASFKCGAYEIRRVNPIGGVNSDNSQFNLAATARMIDRKNPAKSPLLANAITAHGKMNNPPLRDANAPAYKHLEQWVKLMTSEQKPTDAPSAPAGSATPNGPKDEFDPAQFNRPKKDG